eukprot:scaffold187869_cov18-Tisochrysis_lutea.AAC.1
MNKEKSAAELPTLCRPQCTLQLIIYVWKIECKQIGVAILELAECRSSDPAIQNIQNIQSKPSRTSRIRTVEQECIPSLARTQKDMASYSEGQSSSQDTQHTPDTLLWHIVGMSLDLDSLWLSPHLAAQRGRQSLADLGSPLLALTLGMQVKQNFLLGLPNLGGLRCSIQGFQLPLLCLAAEEEPTCRGSSLAAQAH